MREKTQTSLNKSYICPYCHRPNRTEGWLRWHIKNYHPGVITSPAPARVEGFANGVTSLAEIRENYERWKRGEVVS